MRPANSLTTDEIATLRQNIIDEMTMAIKGHGTTVHSFSTAFGEAGQFQNHFYTSMVVKGNLANGVARLLRKSKWHSEEPIFAR